MLFGDFGSVVNAIPEQNASYGPFGSEALTAKMVSFLILGESTKRPFFDVELHDGKSSVRFNIHWMRLEPIFGNKLGE